MNMYALLRNTPRPTMEQVASIFDSLPCMAHCASYFGSQLNVSVRLRATLMATCVVVRAIDRSSLVSRFVWPVKMRLYSFRLLQRTPCVSRESHTLHNVPIQFVMFNQCLLQTFACNARPTGQCVCSTTGGCCREYPTEDTDTVNT